MYASNTASFSRFHGYAKKSGLMLHAGLRLHVAATLIAMTDFEKAAQVAAAEAGQNISEEMLEAVYTTLRSLAARQVGREQAGNTLQATDLVHEAWFRMREAQMTWQNREHFCAVAGRVMRRILVEHARSKNAQKRGGDWQKVTLGTLSQGDAVAIEDLLTLDEALHALEDYDSRKCRIVELAYFGGLEHAEIAQLLDISRTTVHRELVFARAWLKREMEGDGAT